jgi:hypothetical protein
MTVDSELSTTLEISSQAIEGEMQARLDRSGIGRHRGTASSFGLLPERAGAFVMSSGAIYPHPRALFGGRTAFSNLINLRRQWSFGFIASWRASTSGAL